MRITIFLWFLITLLLSSETCARVVYNSTVYVDNTNQVANDSAQCGSPALPCRSISFTLKHRISSSTQVLIRSGGYYDLEESIIIGNYSFISVTSTSSDLSSSETVTVSCSAGAGLSFVECTNVTLHGLTLLNCSALQRSTSRNFSSAEFSFMQFPVAIYFLFCQNINLTTIRISNSNTGLAMLATGGRNHFHDCIFSTNGSPDNNTFPSAGGMYIEFPFCSPQSPKQCWDGEFIEQEQFFTNAEYTITHCHFVENTGHMWHPIEYKYLVPQPRNHLSFGHGGGLSIFFNHARYSKVTVTDCSFRGNRAEKGGGVSVEFLELSWNNTFVMESCEFQNNTAITDLSVSKSTGGGGLKLGFIFLNDLKMANNSIVVTDCNFQNNTAFWGGGVLVSAARENRVQATNSLIFNNCTWFHNLGRVGSALDLSVWAPFVSGSIVVPKFINCNFTQNNDIFTSHLLSPLNEPISVGSLSTHSLPLQFEHSVTFERNNRSALVGTDASIDFMENCSANFTGNIGRNGGAIFLSGSAFLRVHSGTNMSFTGNTASQFGGAIYYSTLGQHELSLFGYCFIQYEHITLHPMNWTSRFFFRSNAAGYESGGDSIYATSLLPCLWTFATPTSKKSYPDPRKVVFCWNNLWQYSDSDCQKQISSAPATFDNNSMYYMELILGKKQIMPIEIVGDKRKNQTQNAVFNVWSHSPDVAHVPSIYTYTSDNTISLYGTPNSSATLALETINPRVIYSEVMVDIMPCPPGFKPKNVSGKGMQCVCNDRYGNVLLCNQGDYIAKLRRGLWIGEDPFTRDTVVGIYPYIAPTMKEPYIQLPNRSSELDRLYCAPVNRKGPFCGQCTNGYAPAINSKLLSCVKCTHSEVQYNWAFYVLLEILPVTFFFFIIMFFHISVTRGAGNSFVFFAQLLTTTFDIDADGGLPVHNFTRVLQQIYEVVYGVWNLDFFSSLMSNFCLARDLNTLTVISLHYIPAIYFLILIPVFYCVVWLYERGIQPVFCLCKPVHRFLRFFQRRWNLNRSMIDAFSTFMVLSYTKFTVVSVYLLTPSTLIYSHGSKLGGALYFQGNIRYLSTEHAPFFLVATFVMIVFVLLPPLLLLVYPLRLVEKLTARLGYRGNFFKVGNRMHLFLDTFQGCFKDGTNGTRDCRYFAGLYFILRTILFAAYAYGGIWLQQYVIQQLVCTVAILLFTTIRPYKKDFYNNLDAVMLGVLAMINALSIYNIYFADVGVPLPNWGFAVQYILIYCPLLYMICYVVWKVVKLRNVPLLSCMGKYLCRRLSKRTSLLSDVLNDGTTSETAADEEYRQFADEVEAFGRDRETNCYRPNTTDTSVYGATDDSTVTSQTSSGISTLNSK